MRLLSDTSSGGAGGGSPEWSRKRQARVKPIKNFASFIALAVLHTKMGLICSCKEVAQENQPRVSS